MAVTQLLDAKRGNITDEMKFVAKKEEIDVEVLREKIAQGRAVILKNRSKTAIIPTGVGENLRTKVAITVGTTVKNTTIEKETDKVRAITQSGADILIDLSVGNLISETRQIIISSTKLPVMANPLIQSAINSYGNNKTINLNKDIILSVIEKMCMDGVDSISLNCCATKKGFEILKTQKRIMGLTTQASMILAQYIENTQEENPMYQYFDEILEIIKPYDIVLSLANTFKPACTADSNDTAQYFETALQGELANRAREYGVQTMVENVGHSKINDIQSSISAIKNITDNAPLFTNAMISENTIGHDNINSSIASFFACLCGANMIYCTPAYENIKCTTSAQARESIMCAKISALCADLAKGNDIATNKNNASIDAYINNSWQSVKANSTDKLALNELEKQFKTQDYFMRLIDKNTLASYKKDLDE